MTRRQGADHRPPPPRPRHPGGLTPARYRALTRAALFPIAERIPRATVDALAAILEADRADAAAIAARCQGWRRELREYLDGGGRLDDAAPLPADWTGTNGASGAVDNGRRRGRKGTTDHDAI